jgi:broad specificity phosphatase PhoE
MLFDMRLILARHGQTPSNVGFLLDTAAPGAELNQIGLEQAAALAEQLACEPIEGVFASNLVRTQQTAAPLAATRGVAVQVIEGLREIPAGDAEMSTDASAYIETLLRWHDGDLEARIPGAENALEFFARFDSAIAEIVAAGHAGAAAVSHGAALRVWASHRVPGFTEALDGGLMTNAGRMVLEGSPELGWTLLELEGVVKYPPMRTLQ